MLNKVMLQGRLVKDPELKQTQSGLSVTRFTVAVDRNIKNKQTGKYDADFADCVAWRKSAEFISRYFRKGDMVIVEGTLQNNNWVDQQGVKHYSNVISVTSVNFCGNKKISNNQNQPQNMSQSPQATVQSMQQQADTNNIDMGELEDFSELVSDGGVPF